MEQAVIGALEWDLLSAEAIDSLIADVLNMEQSRLAQISYQSTLKTRLATLNDEIRRLAGLAAVLPDTTEILEQLTVRESERQRIQSDLAHDPAIKPAINPIKLREKIVASLGRTITLLKTPDDVAAMRIELKKWIEGIRIDGDGKIYIKWRADQIFKLLEITPVSEIGAEGSRCPYFGYRLRSIYEWSPLSAVADSRRAKPEVVGTRESGSIVPLDVAIPHNSGYSGFSGCIGRKGTNLNGCSGFSGFSGQRTA